MSLAGQVNSSATCQISSFYPLSYLSSYLPSLRMYASALTRMCADAEWDSSLKSWKPSRVGQGVGKKVFVFACRATCMQRTPAVGKKVSELACWATTCKQHRPAVGKKVSELACWATTCMQRRPWLGRRRQSLLAGQPACTLGQGGWKKVSPIRS